jgi:phage gp46-like protein
MADAQRPSLDHPPFSASNYETVGAAANVASSQVTWGPASYPNQLVSWESYSPFNNFCEHTIRMKNDWHTSPGSQFDAGSYIGLFNKHPWYDYGLWNHYMYAGCRFWATETVLKIRLYAAKSTIDGVEQYDPDYLAYIPIPDNYDTQDLKMSVSVGPNKGSNFADVTFKWYSALLSIDRTYVMTDVDFTDFIGQFKHQMSVPGYDYGTYSMNNHEVVTSSSPEVPGIDSEEAFGTVNVSAPVPDIEIFPNGIPSLEAFGSPQLTVENVTMNPYITVPRGNLVAQLSRYTGGWSGKANINNIYTSIQRLSDGLWWRSPGVWDAGQWYWSWNNSYYDNVTKTWNMLRSNWPEAFPLLTENVAYRFWVSMYEAGTFDWEQASEEFTYKPIRVDLTPKAGDIRLLYGANLSDFNMDGLDLERDAGLETALLISLFTNKRADPDDVLPDNTNDRGGWHGDVTMDIPVGSRLWLLYRSPTTTEIPTRAVEYIKEALQWLIDDGVAEKVDVEVERNGMDTLQMKLGIYRPKSDPLFFTYYYNWQAQALRYADVQRDTEIKLSLIGG